MFGDAVLAQKSRITHARKRSLCGCVLYPVRTKGTAKNQSPDLCRSFQKTDLDFAHLIRLSKKSKKNSNSNYFLISTGLKKNAEMKIALLIILIEF